jgi:hypothetical protein
MRAASSRTRADSSPSNGSGLLVKIGCSLVGVQCAANRLRRAQRSTAANQRADLAVVWARIQRRRQYLCRRAMCVGSCRQRPLRLWSIAILTFLSVWGLGPPNRTPCPRPCRRLWMKAVMQSRGRSFSGQVPAVPASELQIPRVLVDDCDHPRSAPIQTGAQQCMAALPRIACLGHRRQPPSPAERRRA